LLRQKQKGQNQDTKVNNEQDRWQKKYIVSINGRNFLMKMDGKIRKAGFYTTRFVEAQNVEEQAPPT